ncbi:hypothetical protein Pcinc_026025 [Petrolisthes cinctipes]|uniref:Uncharacterized protein n=1 Tax=Petrolisthes cinctipes TaxID=88211 RepID=A0AAE1F6V1_PETCI|nr:hypothetical protein Pcinc_026025 [Petrolisthes cinctipes]
MPTSDTSTAQHEHLSALHHGTSEAPTYLDASVRPRLPIILMALGRRGMQLANHPGVPFPSAVLPHTLAPAHHHSLGTTHHKQYPHLMSDEYNPLKHAWVMARIHVCHNYLTTF